jgi:hypothetical protein
LVLLFAGPTKVVSFRVRRGEGGGGGVLIIIIIIIITSVRFAFSRKGSGVGKGFPLTTEKKNQWAPFFVERSVRTPRGGVQLLLAELQSVNIFQP